jgi:hypothetical protein
MGGTSCFLRRVLCPARGSRQKRLTGARRRGMLGSTDLLIYCFTDVLNGKEDYFEDTY